MPAEARPDNFLRTLRLQLGAELSGRLSSYTNRTLWHNKLEYTPNKVHESDPDDIKLIKSVLAMLHQLELSYTRIQPLADKSYAQLFISSPKLLWEIVGSLVELKRNYDVISPIAQKNGVSFAGLSSLMDSLKTFYTDGLDIATLKDKLFNLATTLTDHASVLIGDQSKQLTTLLTEKVLTHPKTIRESAIDYEDENTPKEAVSQRGFYTTWLNNTRKAMTVLGRMDPALDEALRTGLTKSGYYDMSPTDKQTVTHIKAVYNLLWGMEQFLIGNATGNYIEYTSRSITALREVIKKYNVEDTPDYTEDDKNNYKAYLMMINEQYISNWGSMVQRLTEEELRYHLKPGTLIDPLQDQYRQLKKIFLKNGILLDDPALEKKALATLQKKIPSHKEFKSLEAIRSITSYVISKLHEVNNISDEEKKILLVKLHHLTKDAANINNHSFLPIQLAVIATLSPQTREKLLHTLSEKKSPLIRKNDDYKELIAALRSTLLPAANSETIHFDEEDIKPLEELEKKIKSQIALKKRNHSEVSEQIHHRKAMIREENRKMTMQLLANRDLATLLNAVKKSQNSPLLNSAAKSQLVALQQYGLNISKTELKTRMKHPYNYVKGLIDNPELLKNILKKCFDESRNPSEKMLCHDLAVQLIQTGFYPFSIQDTKYNHILFYQPQDEKIIDTSKKSLFLDALTKVETSELLKTIDTLSTTNDDNIKQRLTAQLAMYMLAIKDMAMNESNLNSEISHLSTFKNNTNNLTAYLLSSLSDSTDKHPEYKTEIASYIAHLGIQDREIAIALFSNTRINSILKNNLLTKNKNLYYEAKCNQHAITDKAPDHSQFLFTNSEFILQIHEALFSNDSLEGFTKKYLESTENPALLANRINEFITSHCAKDGLAYKNAKKLFGLLARDNKQFRFAIFENACKEFGDLDATYLSHLTEAEKELFHANMQLDLAEYIKPHINTLKDIHRDLSIIDKDYFNEQLTDLKDTIDTLTQKSKRLDKKEYQKHFAIYTSIENTIKEHQKKSAAELNKYHLNNLGNALKELKNLQEKNKLSPMILEMITKRHDQNVERIHQTIIQAEEKPLISQHHLFEDVQEIIDDDILKLEAIRTHQDKIRDLQNTLPPAHREAAIIQTALAYQPKMDTPLYQIESAYRRKIGGIHAHFEAELNFIECLNNIKDILKSYSNNRKNSLTFHISKLRKEKVAHVEMSINKIDALILKINAGELTSPKDRQKELDDTIDALLHGNSALESSNLKLFSSKKEPLLSKKLSAIKALVDKNRIHPEETLTETSTTATESTGKTAQKP